MRETSVNRSSRGAHQRSRLDRVLGNVVAAAQVQHLHRNVRNHEKQNHTSQARKCTYRDQYIGGTYTYRLATIVEWKRIYTQHVSDRTQYESSNTGATSGEHSGTRIPNGSPVSRCSFGSGRVWTLTSCCTRPSSPSAAQCTAVRLE